MDKGSREYREKRAQIQKRLMDGSYDCAKCGAPYEDLIVQDAEFDMDGDMIEPPVVAWVPLCECWHDEM